MSAWLWLCILAVPVVMLVLVGISIRKTYRNTPDQRVPGGPRSRVWSEGERDAYRAKVRRERARSKLSDIE